MLSVVVEGLIFVQKPLASQNTGGDVMLYVVVKSVCHSPGQSHNTGRSVFRGRMSDSYVPDRYAVTIPSSFLLFIYFFDFLLSSITSKPRRIAVIHLKRKIGSHCSIILNIGLWRRHSAHRANTRRKQGNGVAYLQA